MQTREFFAVAGLCLAAALVAAGAAGAEKNGRSVEVASDRADYAADGKRAVFVGNVRVVAGGLLLRAQTLSVGRFADGNVYEALGAPLSVFCDDCGADDIVGSVGAKAEYREGERALFLRGGVDLCAGKNCERGRAQANSVNWQNGRAHFVGAAGAPARLRWRRASGETVRLQAQNIRYNSKTGAGELRGKASVGRGESKIVGETIRFNIKTGELAAGGEGASEGGGRVRATFGGEAGQAQ